MPAGTPFTKITRTETLGAHVVLAGPTLTEATIEANASPQRTGATIVPPFDDTAVIAGQGTVALEMIAARPDLEVLVVPVGGGGLLAGMAVAAEARASRHRDRRCAVGALRVDGARARPDRRTPRAARRSPKGIAVTEPGRLTTEIVGALADDLLVVREESIEEAIGLYLEIEKVVVEGAGAASLAAVLEHGTRFAGRRVGLVVSGGNIDLRVLSSVILRARWHAPAVSCASGSRSWISPGRSRRSRRSSARRAATSSTCPTTAICPACR